ncbi:MAG: amidohydrolase family protein [Deltaproteobacteria bacterium]|nr:amidohydrolase family protein [Deltaproteobacteria bacterium]
MESEGLLINYLSYTGANTLRALAGVPEDRPADGHQIAAMAAMAEEEMRAGALGVSYGLEYQPAASWEEVLALGFAAGRHGGMTAAHARSGGLGQSALDAVEEMLRLARDTGIPHQYSHIGSMLAYGDGMDEALNRLARAQAEGLRVTSDIYGYDAGMAGINASQLDPGVFDRFGCEPSDLEVLTDVILDGSLVMAAGSRFVSREQYARIRQAFFENRLDGCPIIIAHTQKWAKIRLAMKSPHVCICSDGAVYGSDDGQTFFSHPRVAGAFAVWLGRFVREEGVTDLMTGLFKASTMAALILGLSGKGRVALGADADLTIFDPGTVIDRAGYGEGFMTPPEGIAYVLVNGKTTVSRGRLVPGVLAGRPVRRTWEVPGYRLGG